LEYEHVAAAHVLEQFDHHLAVGKPPDDAAPEADVHVPDDGLGKLGIGIAGEYPHALKRHEYRPRKVPTRSCCNNQGPGNWLGR